MNPEMNSGIQFRSEIKDANDTCHVTDLKTPERVHGYQMEIDPSLRHGVAVFMMKHEEAGYIHWNIILERKAHLRITNGITIV